MKKILLITDTKLKQSDELVDLFISSLQADPRVSIEHINLKAKDLKLSKQGYCPLLDELASSQNACEIEELESTINCDLIVLIDEFKHLSIKNCLRAFLNSYEGKKILKDKPVVNIALSSQMWHSASSELKTLLEQAGAKLIDNVILAPQGLFCKNFLARLMSEAKRKEYDLLSYKQMQNSQRFALAIMQGLINDEEKSFNSLCQGLKACQTDERLAKSEFIAKKSLSFLRELSFNKYLQPISAFAFVIVFIATALSICFFSIRRKLNPLKAKNIRASLALPSGDEDFRMKDF